MKKPKLEIILLSIILLFALFLRLYALGNPPFWIDESSSAIASKNILQKGVPVFDSGLLYSRAFLFHYSQAFFMLFGQNEFLARFPSVIFGLLTIVLAYFIGKEYSKSGGIISALFMSVFYLEVFFSRQARFYQLFQLAFFACLYFLYKSKEDKKENKNYLYLSLLFFIIAWDVQIEALVLAPFLILHILIYNKQKWLSLIPVIVLITHFMPAIGLSAGYTEMAKNYMQDYFAYACKMRYLLVFLIPGVVWSFVKNKKLTLLLIIPSVITLIGIFSLKVFALRYSYFFVFPLVLYSSLLLSFLYEQYGRIFLIALIAVFIFPSNLFFPYTYVNVIKPVSTNLADYSAPYTNYKALPPDLIEQLRNSTLVSLFSSDVEWYIKKPDYVIPFSMNGIGDDQISYNSTNRTVDRYSGADVLQPDQTIPRPFCITADSFSLSKLKPSQSSTFDKLIENCSIPYEAQDLKVYYCS